MIDVQPGEYGQTIAIYFKLRILCYSNSFAFLKDHTVSDNRSLLPSCDLASLTC